MVNEVAAELTMRLPTSSSMAESDYAHDKGGLNGGTSAGTFVGERPGRPHVTFLCYNIFGIGGTVMSVTNAANYLFEKGYRVEIISMCRNADVPVLGLNSQILIHSLYDSRRGKRKQLGLLNKFLSKMPSTLFNRQEDLYRRVNMLMDLRLKAALRSTRTDVLIATIPSLARAAIVTEDRTYATLIQEHKYFGAHRPAIQRMIRKYYRHADALMVLTRADQREYREITELEPIHVSNGMRVARDTRLNPASCRRIIALGRLDPQKQYHLLFDAFAKASEGLADWELHLFGEGAERKRLTSLIAELGMSGRIHLRGATSNAFDEMLASDICAVSSTFEGFGMTFIEAYAARKPVVTFDIDRGPKEIVIDGVTGLKAKPFDTTDYAAKLKALMASEDLRTRMGNAGFELFTREFSMDVIGPRLESAIAIAHATHNGGAHTCGQ